MKLYEILGDDEVRIAGPIREILKMIADLKKRIKRLEGNNG